MIKAVLIDDEQPAIIELEYLLSAYGDISIEATFNQPQLALQYILFHQVDVVFLDISMPEMDGFLVAEALLQLKAPPMIVFVTAYDEYAIKAFEISAVDYLLKPIQEARLETAVIRLRNITSMKQVQKPINTMIKERHKSLKTTRIPLWRAGSISLLKHDEINCVEAQKGETLLHTTSGIFTSTDSVQYFEDILKDSGFFRCHRGFLIRIESIIEVVPWYNNSYAVKIQAFEGTEVPVSRRNIKEFKQILNL